MYIYSFFYNTLFLRCYNCNNAHGHFVKLAQIDSHQTALWKKSKKALRYLLRQTNFTLIDSIDLLHNNILTDFLKSLLCKRSNI